VYLTWQGDPGTTMTVNYHTPSPAPTSLVLYDTLSHRGHPDDYPLWARGGQHQLEGLRDGRAIHWVELKDLRPGATYYFIAGDRENGFSEEFKFRTAPGDQRPICFVAGGDMGVKPPVQDLLEQAALQEPLFALIGGDLAYENGKLQEYRKMDAWLENWAQRMKTPQGYMVPMVVAIGNHEVDGGYAKTPEQAPFYFGYFAQEGRQSYFVRRFGANIVLLVLDSGHIAQHGEAQAQWLEEQLQQHSQVPFCFAAYHVPLYPGYRDYGGEHSKQGRRHWLPLFDRYRLTASFEHHDHLLKRTKLLRAGRVDPEGTLYLGDGCMGRKPRRVKHWYGISRSRRWYIEKLEGRAHFWRVEVDQEGVEYRAIDEKGRVIDQYTQPRKP